MPPWFLTTVWIWIALGVITFIMLLYFDIRAPYGRHTRPGWGKLIDNHWGWFWMELPALVVMPLLAWLGPNPKSALLLLLTGLWVWHYGYRVLVFPFRLRTANKKMPVSILFSAFGFNLINGFLNGYYLGFLAVSEAPFLDPGRLSLWSGLLLFFGGMSINRSADRRLIALREQQTGYRIPRGWLFAYISCPNHLGEIIEWVGFAVIAWNLPALSFAVWTFCNLAPRAWNHHQWYREHFAEYPAERKALIPGLW